MFHRSSPPLSDPKQLSTSRRTVIEGAAVTDNRRPIRIRRPAALHRLEGGIMRAARFYDRQDIRIKDIPEPDLLPITVAIDAASSGICGTYVHEYLEGPIFAPPAGHPHPISGESAPVTMGHEFSGTITALGEGVTDLEVGQTVVVEPYIIADDVDTSIGQSYQ